MGTSTSAVGRLLPAISSLLRPPPAGELREYGGVALVRRKRVIDVGCGDGRMALGCAPYASEVVGVDRRGHRLVPLAGRRPLLAPRALRGPADAAALSRRPRAFRASGALDGRSGDTKTVGRRPVGDPARRAPRAARAALARQREGRLPHRLVAF